MNKIKLSPVGIAAASMNEFASAARRAIENAVNIQERLMEITTLTNETPEKIMEFYKAHNYTWEYIRLVLLKGGELTKESMESYDPLPFHPLSAGDFGVKFTWKDRIIDCLESIAFGIGYWFAFPFVWFAFWFWDGIKEAWRDVWE